MERVVCSDGLNIAGAIEKENKDVVWFSSVVFSVFSDLKAISRDRVMAELLIVD
ncbi:MAG: hypothetical protein AAGD25_32490 [Cyanobacteria bacterium P01_F01_bin.150]